MYKYLIKDKIFPYLLKSAALNLLVFILMVLYVFTTTLLPIVIPQVHGAWISFPPPPFLYYPPFFKIFI